MDRQANMSEQDNTVILNTDNTAIEIELLDDQNSDLSHYISDLSTDTNSSSSDEE